MIETVLQPADSLFLFVDYQAGLGMTLRGFIAASLGGMSPLSGIFGDYASRAPVASFF